MLERDMDAEALIVRDEIDALADRIAVTAASIDAATHTLLTDIREFDDAGGWHLQGALSCAHWLQWRVGIALGAGREKVRVARRLGELPLIDEALRKGEVSYSKVRAMSRVASAANEATLLELAQASTAAQLERICRLYRQVAQADQPTPDGDAERRWVRQRGCDDGMIRVSARLHPDEAARVMKAIGVSAETLRQPDRDGDLADGLVALADAALDGDSGAPAIEAVVRVEVDAATMTGVLEDGTGVSAETSRRLCCDAGIIPVAVDERGTPLSVGRKQRRLSSAIRRALAQRDRCCQFPSCTNQSWLDAHHIEHWADGGETCLDNLVHLCRRHHRYVHEYGFSLEKRAGEPVFRDRQGRVVPTSGERGLAHQRISAQMHEALARNRVTITPETALPSWDGSRPDYGLCVEALSQADGLL